jgi:5-methylcytosine-specific restriction endonuclease McrBC regulatory subunit McrC
MAKSRAQQAAIAVSMKNAGKKPKSLPKAQSGKIVKPTADSTLVYNKQQQNEFKTQADLVKKSKGTGKSLDSIYKSKPFTESLKKQEIARANQIRQQFKGKPGYDKNGFPIKKSTVKKKK